MGLPTPAGKAAVRLFFFPSKGLGPARPVGGEVEH